MKALIFIITLLLIIILAQQIDWTFLSIFDLSFIVEAHKAMPNWFQLLFNWIFRIGVLTASILVGLRIYYIYKEQTNF